MVFLIEPESRQVLLNAFFIFLSLVFSTAVAAAMAYRLGHPSPTSKRTATVEAHRSQKETPSPFSLSNAAPIVTAHELEKVDPSLGLHIHATQTPRFESSKQSLEGAARGRTPMFSRNFSSFGYVFGPERPKALSSSPPHHIDLIQKESSVFFHHPRYSESDLRNLLSHRSIETHEVLQLSRLLRFESSLPLPRFDTVKVATDVILEVSAALCEHDPTCRALGLFQLAAIGGSREIYDNPIYYHERFCSLVEEQIDSVDWLKNSISVGELQMMLVDLIVCFSWSHWNWDDFVTSVGKGPFPKKTPLLDSPMEIACVESLSRIIEYFDRDHVKPFLMPHLAIFRLLSKLYLTTPQFTSVVAKLKLRTVFHICTMNTKCYEHRQLLPLVSQSVVAAENECTKIFFYDIASQIVSPHVSCCIEMQDVFYPKSDLQGLILQGLWVGQPLGIRTKAAILARHLGKVYPEVNLWSDPVKLTKIPAHTPDYSKVPGSWMKYSI